MSYLLALYQTEENKKNAIAVKEALASFKIEVNIIDTNNAIGLSITMPEPNPRKAGRKPSAPDFFLEDAYKLIKQLGADAAARELGMAKSTMYRKIKEAESHHFNSTY